MAFFLIVLVSLFPFSLWSQAVSPRFEHLTTDDGLSQNEVRSIIQDYRGFLWIGTHDGLNRYDGYKIKEYKFRPSDTTSLLKNNIGFVFEDSRRNLWVYARGLHLYDREHDRFKRILSAKNFPGSLQSLFLNAMAEDQHGNLWLAFYDFGLYHLETTDTVEADHPGSGLPYRLRGPYPYWDEPAESGAHPRIHNLQQIGQHLWVSFVTGLSRLSLPPDQTIPDPETVTYESMLNQLPPAGKYSECQFFKSPDQSLWIANPLGLIYLKTPGSPEQYRFFPYPRHYFPEDWLSIAKKITAGPEGKLWIGTYGGLVIFDPRNETFQHISEQPAISEGLSFNNISDIYVDQGKVTWIGTVGMGINKYMGAAKPFHHFLAKDHYKDNFSVFELLEDHSGKIWLAANLRDLYELDPLSGVIRQVAPAGEWYINYMTTDENGIFWIINNTSLVRFDPIQDQIRQYGIPNAENMVQITAASTKIHIDQDGGIWLCNSEALHQFDPQTETFSTFLLPQPNPLKIESFYRIAAHRFLIGSAQGLFYYDLSPEESQLFSTQIPLPDSLMNHYINCLYPDPRQPDRYFWAGTAGSGLLRLDMAENTVSVFTENDGLSNDYIYGILSDEAGRLWMSTNHGLSRFEPGSNSFSTYDVQDGLQSNEFNTGSFFKSKSGALFFGGRNGFNAFKPDEIKPNLHLPNIALTDFLLDHKSVVPGAPDSLLKGSVTETKEIRLTHQQNNIAFEYSALDFSNPEKNQYRYKLEGWEDEWVNVGTLRRASYNNLPPGQYTFRVQGTNNDGIWSDQEASVKVLIAYPVWNTWPAYFSYLVIIALIAFVVYRYFSERRRLREALRIKKLEAKNLAELDQFKSRFFANVSHEFRTPITLIQGKIEELLSTLPQHSHRESLNSLKKNSHQLLQLIEQLLDIARLESKKMILKRSSGDVIQFLRILIQSFQSTADVKSIELAFKSDPDDLITTFDPDAFQKIVQNLLSNAIKFSQPEGRVTLKVETFQVAADGEEPSEKWLRILVSDNGAGIEKDQLPHIFERFYQGNQNGPQPVRGFGLGLALIKELVMLHKER